MARKISAFLLVFFFTIFSTELSAFSTKVEEGTPSLHVKGICANPVDGVIYLITSAPEHLAFCSEYAPSNEEDHTEIEGNLILATHPSRNPHTVSFHVSAQNVEGGGINFTITETQTIKKEGWCTDSWSKKRAKQVVYEPFRSLDVSEPAELYIKEDQQNMTLVKFKLADS
ncbi:MAG: hypothetical protein SNF33_07580 [Candidatus Algichlamydia australiensis]|nr:hypothetical protein [Chlamydiales bacterium]